MAGHFPNRDEGVAVKAEEVGFVDNIRVQQHDTSHRGDVKLELIDDKHDSTDENIAVMETHNDDRTTAETKHSGPATNESRVPESEADATAAEKIASLQQMLDDRNELIGILEKRLKSRDKKIVMLERLNALHEEWMEKIKLASTKMVRETQRLANEQYKELVKEVFDMVDEMEDMLLQSLDAESQFIVLVFAGLLMKTNPI
ncbi:uncharacterized protein AB675_3413 [Cyphellophora attinorum]|uniref:Uncharacterized protein n=1 Tax=Cyphellophora attinorum TaxID=1664694 RepID=A0A0N1H3X1_9EURO|nr:uncharacterized protein AB675_3413 [Phialophora attinorum]KPI39850.1 hypothetical protein AB675_3413 [Phialophora attinorum]